MKGVKEVNFDKVNEYIENLYKKEGVDKKTYIDNTSFKDFIPVVDQDVSRFLSLVLCLTNATSVLEIGTSIGYSTVSMANTIKSNDGKIITVEFDDTVAKQAKENFIRSGVDDIIDIRIGDAKEILPSLNEKFDLIFLDVDKRLYKPLLGECIRLLKGNGVLLAEDTLFPVIELDEKWHYLIPAIEEFNRAIVDSEEVQSTILPIGDGVTVAVKKKK